MTFFLSSQFTKKKKGYLQIMNRHEIQAYINTLKQKETRRVYTPYKYFKGLHTKKEIATRFHEIVRGSKSAVNEPQSYKPFLTDKEKKTTPSKYTKAFEARFGPHHTSLAAKAKVSGVPLSIIEQVYRKGKAAWRTGHRVGATEEQWGYARVHSFLTLGCTAFSADFSLLEEALSVMDIVAKRQFLCQPIQCPLTTLRKAYYTKRGAQQVVDTWRQSYCTY